MWCVLSEEKKCLGNVIFHLRKHEPCLALVQQNEKRCRYETDALPVYFMIVALPENYVKLLLFPGEQQYKNVCKLFLPHINILA